MVQINQKAPEFSAKAFHDGDFKTVKLSDFRGRWVVLFFYPADFTFVCPTELGELAKHYPEFKKLGAEILSVSRDTEFVHKAWHDHSETIKTVRFPMIADPTANICKDYGVYIDEDGLSLRGTFIINPEGVLKAFEVHDNSIGRSVEELMRKLQAAQYVSSHKGEVCPMNWEPGAKTLKPGIGLVGKI
ncbi:MAG TPA: alkyl hydroperoxide reductase subunit C [Candidatus Nanoarchaeia archaeon]|nr:alkyl hydroperoxide reductase subunit C [Candidatus Nanoarchaeia archaeon]